MFYARSAGLAVTYSPASWDAVPSARRRLTAEFGMGSGVSLALMPPDLQNARGSRAFWPSVARHESVFSKSWTDFGSDGLRPEPDAARMRGPVFHWIGIKPVGRLVPVN